MKKINIFVVAAMVTAAAVSGCAGVYTVTDNVTLYPKNKAAQQFGTLSFYAQYPSNTSVNKIAISLPNGKILHGQMTYIEDSGTTVTEDGFWDNFHFGIGTGFGHHSHGGFIGASASPKIGHYRSDKSRVSINAYGDNLALNCQGEFNHRQRAGAVDCQMTNGMVYQGTIRRMMVK
ncbi:MAG: hypothetical protein CSA45_01660 [Gammaproteobacteria bacterium]|nr:MAG: hypothetical protein CSA45_01660 [Gammaproteobacteria bacterium]